MVEFYVDKRNFIGVFIINIIVRVVKYNGDLCIVMIDWYLWKENFRYEEDVFIGMMYKKLFRYYLFGIYKEFIRYGIENYIEWKGVKVSYLIFFKLKYGGLFLLVKVNVLL